MVDRSARAALDFPDLPADMRPGQSRARMAATAENGSAEAPKP